MVANNDKEEQYGHHWMDRIRKADEYFFKWEKKFRCKVLDKYIDGLLNKEEGGIAFYINLFYSAIKVKKPTILFSRPQFTLSPKPWKMDWNPDAAILTAQMKQDTLNSFISNAQLKFSEEIDMAILDSWSYFGMLEVGYGADWVKNPNAGKPALKGDYYDLNNDEEGKVIYEPPEIPEREYVYFKRIPAHRFRVGGCDSHSLERSNWCGYYEFVRTEDILANKKNFKNVSEADWPHSRSDDYYWDSDADKEAEFTTKGDFTKIWKVWDNRYKQFSIIMESQEKCIYKEPFARLPLFPLRFDSRRTGFYPVPVTFNWKSPQDEYNETHNQLRNYRRRTRAMWQVMEGMVDSDEKDKFVTGPDFQIITVKRDQAIQPINNPALDASILNAMQISSTDFDKVSGTSNPQKGVSDRTTATEAATIEQRSRVREEAERDVIAEWLCAIGRETLMVVMERFSEPFWIKQTLDQGELGEEVQDSAARYSLINSAMLEDGVDFNLNIQVSSLSPVTNEAEKRKFFEFISILQNFPVLSLHPTLIREAAYRCDYRNEQVIRAVQQMAQLQMVAQMEQGKQNLAAQGQGTTVSQNIQAKATPPQQEEVRQQVQNLNPTLQ